MCHEYKCGIILSNKSFTKLRYWEGPIEDVVQAAKRMLLTVSRNRMPISTLLVKASSSIGGEGTGKNEMNECCLGWNEAEDDSTERPELGKFDSREQQEEINQPDVLRMSLKVWWYYNSHRNALFCVFIFEFVPGIVKCA